MIPYNSTNKPTKVSTSTAIIILSLTAAGFAAFFHALWQPAPAPAPAPAARGGSQQVSRVAPSQGQKSEPPEPQEELRVPLPGRSWTITKLGLVMQPIPAGSFVMGTHPDEKDRVVKGSPLAQVTITSPFWLGKTEVTWDQWRTIMGKNPGPRIETWTVSSSGSVSLHSYKSRNSRPVGFVSWNDAMAFCQVLTALQRAEGRLPKSYRYTLPTDAQWEYSCRAGTTSAYAGDLDAMAWYHKQAYTGTQPVGMKQANAWGLHDMHGNASEWCADWYRYELPLGPVADPTGPASGNERVVRGGSWIDVAGLCRSAVRASHGPNFRIDSLGFRLALIESLD